MCWKFIIHADFAAICILPFSSLAYTFQFSQNTSKSGHTLAGWSGSIHPKIELAWKMAQEPRWKEVSADEIMEPIDKIDRNEWPGTDHVPAQRNMTQLWFTEASQKLLATTELSGSSQYLAWVSITSVLNNKIYGEVNKYYMKNMVSCRKRKMVVVR